MGTAFLYGNGGSGTGATLTVTAPAGCTVTVSKDGKTKTKVAGADGVAVFRGLATGQWTVTITDGEHTAQKTVTVTADYSTAITFFASTIRVKYPVGSTCTATDGVTTLTAPDTSGTWECVVPNAGTWTVSVSGRDWTESVEITGNNQSAQVDISKYYLFNDGNQYTDVTGGWSVDGYSRNGGPLYGATVGDTMVFPYISGNYAYVAGTQKKINLTYVDTICADVTIEEPGLSHAALVIDDDKEITSIVAQTTFHDSAGTKTVKLNFSEKTGEYYIYICTIQNKLTVRKVWME